MGLEAITGVFGSFTMSGVGGFAFQVIIGLLGGGILAFMIWFIMRQMQYKTRCIILEELSDGGTLVSFDKGRFKTRSDKTSVFLLRRRKNSKSQLSPPPANSMLFDDKGRKIVFLKKFGNGIFDYYPLGLSLRGVQVYLTPFLTSRQNWISTEIKRQHQRYGGFWEKYGGVIVMGSMIIFGGIMLIILFKMNQDTAEVIGKGMEQLAGAVNNFKDANVQTIMPPGI